jgi:hypothetical protein
MKAAVLFLALITGACQVAGAAANLAQLGMGERDWKRAERIYSEKSGLSPRGPGSIDAYRAGRKYYYFKNGVLVATGTQKLSSESVARLDERKIRDEYLARPPLGIQEADWREAFSHTALVAVGRGAEGRGIFVYKSGTSYFHFRQGLLVEVAAERRPDREIAQLDAVPILTGYFGESRPGMTLREWQRPLIYRDGTVSAYNVDGVFHYFKNGVLVSVAPSVISAKTIAGLAYPKLRVARIEPTPVFYDGPLEERVGRPGRSQWDSFPRSGYEPSDSTGLGPEWDRTARENMRRELPRPVAD